MSETGKNICVDEDTITKETSNYLSVDNTNKNNI